MLFYWWCQCFHSTCSNFMKGLKVLKKDQWCCQVAFCFFSNFVTSSNFIGHCQWAMIYCCRFWNYDILLKCLEIMRFKNIYFDWCQIFLIDVKNILHKDPLGIRERFWDVKMENRFRNNTKNTRHKTGTHFKIQLWIMIERVCRKSGHVELYPVMDKLGMFQSWSGKID